MYRFDHHCRSFRIDLSQAQSGPPTDLAASAGAFFRGQKLRNVVDSRTLALMS